MDDHPICCADIDDRDRRNIMLGVLAALAGAGAAQAQDAAKVQSSAFKVVLDNDKLRVLEFNSRPGMGTCGSGMHSHPAGLMIPLTDIKMRFALPDGKTGVAEVKGGTAMWLEARTHETENVSGRDIQALLVELKPAPAAAKT